MKAVINGLRYDTEKAELIGEADFGYRKDFRYFEETLYCTASGRFFLAGEGGPLTRWARINADNSKSGGKGIVAMDKIEALAWAEKNLTAEQIENAFADDLLEA